MAHHIIHRAAVSGGPTDFFTVKIVNNGVDGDCVQWLPFNEPSGVPADGSGNGNDAAAVDGTVLYQQTALSAGHDYSIAFDGTAGGDACVVTVTGIDMQSDFTAAGAVSESTGGDSIFQIDGGTGYLALYCIDTTTVRLRYFSGSIYEQDATVTAATPFAWCIALDATAKTLDWWIDGVKQTQVTGWATNGTSTKTMYGGSDTAGIGEFNGRLQHHGMFNAVLADGVCADLSTLT